MEEKNKIDYEEEINNAVQYAVRSGDFSHLAGELKSSMQGILNKTMGEVQKTVSETMGGVSGTKGHRYGPQNNQGTPRPVYQRPVYVVPNRPRRSQIIKTPVQPSGGSIAAFVMGILGTIFFSIGLIGGLTFALVSGWGASTIPLGIFSALLAGSIVMIVKGSQGMQRIQRYKRYWGLLLEKGFCDITRLAQAVRKNTSFVVNDITQMMRRGWFPEGHMDEKKTCLIYGKELYQQYLTTQEQQKRLLLEQEKRAKDETGLYAVVDAGKEWIAQIQKANEKLPGEVISNKLYQLEDVTTHIFAYVEQRPEKLPEIRKFMEYYLPTTIKLVNAYCEFEAQPVQMESIQQTKKEIEESLDTINQAFAALLENLYQDDAIDISTDISALKAMLAQEGLSQDKIGK